MSKPDAASARPWGDLIVGLRAHNAFAMSQGEYDAALALARAVRGDHDKYINELGSKCKCSLCDLARKVLAGVDA